MKRVLFLAPNYKYIWTTVRGVTDDLAKRKMEFTTNITDIIVKDTYIGNINDLYLKTSDVEVIFVNKDPVTWDIGMLNKINAVFGQKDLVTHCQERFYISAPIIYGKGSVQKYILDHTYTSTDPTVYQDIAPKTQYIPEIKNVYFNNPVTVVMWSDGTKTIVRCQDDDFYSEEAGLAICIAKKALGNKGNFNNIFKKWLPERKEVETQSMLACMLSNIRGFWNSEESKEEKHG